MKFELEGARLSIDDQRKATVTNIGKQEIEYTFTCPSNQKQGGRLKPGETTEGEKLLFHGQWTFSVSLYKDMTEQVHAAEGAVVAIAKLHSLVKECGRRTATEAMLQMMIEHLRPLACGENELTGKPRSMKFTI